MSYELQALSDENIRYWLAFHVRRIERETANARKHRDSVQDERRSPEYVANLIEQCELTIFHSERALVDLRAEAERRGLEI